MKWADKGGGDFTPPPIGNHVARCVRVIDLGTQTGEYMGEKTVKRQCMIGWELPTELIQGGEYDGKPFLVSKFYTASLSEKANLRKDLESWRGRAFTERELEGFDSKNVLGVPCLVNVIHETKKGRTRAKITSVTGIAKGMQVPAQVTPSIYFSLEEFDPTVFAALSDGIKKIIQQSPEFVAIAKSSAGGAHDEAYGAGWEPGDGPQEEDSSIPF